MNRNKSQKEHYISFRVDNGLYEKIEHGARNAEISRGEYIRRQLEKGKVVVKSEIVADVPELKRLLGQLGKIGSNLNQIAHYFNGGGARSKEMFEKTAKAVQAVYSMKYEIEKMGGDFRGYSQAYSHKKQ